MDTADFEVLDVTAGDPRSVNSLSAAHVPDLNTSVSGEKSSEVESISRSETPYSTCRKTKVMPQIQSKFPQTGGNLLST